MEKRRQVATTTTKKGGKRCQQYGYRSEQKGKGQNTPEQPIKKTQARPTNKKKKKRKESFFLKKTRLASSFFSLSCNLVDVRHVVARHIMRVGDRRGPHTPTRVGYRLLYTVFHVLPREKDQPLIQRNQKKKNPSYSHSSSSALQQ
jgi:hypothetical protein